MFAWPVMLTWNPGLRDARKEPKTFSAAPPRRRPDACVEARAVCIAAAKSRHPPVDRGARRVRATCRLGRNLHQGVLPSGAGRAGAAHTLSEMAMAAFL